MISTPRACQINQEKERNGGLRVRNGPLLTVIYVSLSWKVETVEVIYEIIVVF